MILKMFQKRKLSFPSHLRLEKLNWYKESAFARTIYYKDINFHKNK